MSTMDNLAIGLLNVTNMELYLIKPEQVIHGHPV